MRFNVIQHEESKSDGRFKKFLVFIHVYRDVSFLTLIFAFRHFDGAQSLGGEYCHGSDPKLEYFQIIFKLFSNYFQNYYFFSRFGMLVTLLFFVCHFSLFFGQLYVLFVSLSFFVNCNFSIK
jgi:hypothetical protein